MRMLVSELFECISQHWWLFDYFAFDHQDDVWRQDKIEKAIKALSKAPRVRHSTALAQKLLTPRVIKLSVFIKFQQAVFISNASSKYQLTATLWCSIRQQRIWLRPQRIKMLRWFPATGGVIRLLLALAAMLLWPTSMSKVSSTWQQSRGESRNWYPRFYGSEGCYKTFPLEWRQPEGTGWPWTPTDIP